MGESQVGKTSLVSQFLTSEFMNTYDASLGRFKHYSSLSTRSQGLRNIFSSNTKSFCVTLIGKVLKKS